MAALIFAVCSWREQGPCSMSDRPFHRNGTTIRDLRRSGLFLTAKRNVRALCDDSWRFSRLNMHDTESTFRQEMEKAVFHPDKASTFR